MTDLSGKKIAIIATDYFEEAELVTPRDELAKAGAEVKVYSQSGESIQAVEGDTEPTQKIEVDGSLSDVDVARFDAVVVPGGTINADHLRLDEDAQSIAKEAYDHDKVLAVICHGPWLLVNAGLADGRRLTSYPSLSKDLRERRRHVGRRGGRRGRPADHQPQPRRPARLRRRDQHGTGRLTPAYSPTRTATSPSSLRGGSGSFTGDPVKPHRAG